MVLELRLAPDTRACLIPAVTSTCSLFRSVRLGRCNTRQLREHRSRAAQETTRWGCEPQTLGPISQTQGFYTTGCRASGRHSRMSMLESPFRCDGSSPGLRLESRRVVSNLGVGSPGQGFLGGGVGGSSRGAGLSTNNTAPQLPPKLSPKFGLVRAARACIAARITLV